MVFVVYNVFIGALLAAFVGVGIAAFSPDPVHPVPPPAVVAPGAIQPSADVEREVQTYQKQLADYQDLLAVYSRDVAIVSAVGAILMLVVSVTLLRGAALFSDGFVLGGILTFSYSVLRGFMAEDNMVRLLIVSAGLIITLALGYVRFVRPQLTLVEPGEPSGENRRAA